MKYLKSNKLLLAISITALLLSLGGLVKANPLKETRSGAPSVVSYQGNIWDGDTPFSGTGYFRFSIFDSGINTVWSNDGNDPPTTAIPLPVINGLFSLNLGDTKLTGMTEPLTADVFKDPDTFLQVWFSPDNVTWTTMPEQAIAAVPYALQAQVAVNADSATNAASADNATNATNAINATNAANADKLDNFHSTSFQMRVTGTCPVGQAVRVVNADGSVACQAVAEYSTFTRTSLWTTGNAGRYSSIITGSDGLGFIAFYDETNGYLRSIHCSDLNCTGGLSYTLDNGNVGQYVDVAIGMDGFPLISYYDAANGDLLAIHCNDVTCSSWSTTILDSANDVGQYTSITIGGDGYGLISYYYTTGSDLRVAHCSNVSCSSFTVSTLESTISAGQYTSITSGTDGLGLISYYDLTNNDLKVAHCDNATCSSATITTIDSIGIVGRYTSITITADGMGLISYFDNSNYDLKVATCSNTTCSGAYTFAIDSDWVWVGDYTSITTGADGLGLISYYDIDNDDLKVAHCNNLDCQTATIYTLDSVGNVGLYTSIAIDANGLGLISYYDSSNQDLKVAHCSNELCIPINWED